MWRFIFVCLKSDREKAEGLPVAPFMDRDKVSKPTAQIGFIKFVLIPLFELLNKVSSLRNGNVQLCFCSGPFYSTSETYSIILHITYNIRAQYISVTKR